jgi:hypothetical protein
MNLSDVYGINATGDLDEIRGYAASEIAEHGKIAPCLTLYRFGTKMMTIYFPREAPPEGRDYHLNQAAFAANLFATSAARLIIDSTAMKSSFLKDITPDNDGYIDALLVCYFSNIGIKCVPLPYTMHPENNYPIWEDVERVDAGKDILDTQGNVVSFASLSFLMGSSTLPWDSYLKYLDHMGYTISYHHPYSAEAIGSVLTLTIG